MMDFEIRKANDNDKDEIIRIIGVAMNEYEAGYARETLDFHFFCRSNGKDDGREYLVMIIDGQVAGISGTHRYIWGPPDVKWLGWFALHPKWHGNGLGKALMDETLKVVRDQCRLLLIETYAGDTFTRARNFYREYGFRLFGEVKDYMAKDNDMVVFGMDLSESV